LLNVITSHTLKFAHVCHSFIILRLSLHCNFAIYSKTEVIKVRKKHAVFYSHQKAICV